MNPYAACPDEEPNSHREGSSPKYQQGLCFDVLKATRPIFT